jgi:hypothetical protein
MFDMPMIGTSSAISSVVKGMLQFEEVTKEGATKIVQK